MPGDNGRELLLHELRDMYDAEHRFAEALTRMVDNASNRSLADGFRRHHEATRRQIVRLEDCFRTMGDRPSRERCAGAQGLVEEYESFIRNQRPDATTRDVFAAGLALKIEHYEIASYVTMIDLALRLDMSSCADMFEKNLKEEEATAAELELASRKLGAELTGSHTGLRGAVTVLGAASRSGGVGAMGRAVASQATDALGRLEQRGRRARTTSTRKRTATRKKTTRAKSATRRATTARRKTTTGRRTTTGRKKPTARRTTAARTTSRRPATRRPTSRRTTTRRPATRRTTTRTGTRRTTRATGARRRTTRARASR